MTGWRCFTAIGLLSFAMLLVLGSRPGMTQSRAHVYLFRGLADVFSLGMDTLADELNSQELMQHRTAITTGNQSLTRRR